MTDRLLQARAAVTDKTIERQMCRRLDGGVSECAHKRSAVFMGTHGYAYTKVQRVHKKRPPKDLEIATTNLHVARN